MSELKQIRGQIRQVVKEILPEVLNEQQYEALKTHVDARMNEVEKYVKETIDLMNVRQREILKYLVESYQLVGSQQSKEEMTKKED